MRIFIAKIDITDIVKNIDLYESCHSSRPVEIISMHCQKVKITFKSGESLWIQDDRRWGDVIISDKVTERDRKIFSQFSKVYEFTKDLHRIIITDVLNGVSIIVTKKTNRDSVPSGGGWELFDFDKPYQEPGKATYYNQDLTPKKAYESIRIKKEDIFTSLNPCHEILWEPINLQKIINKCGPTQCANYNDKIITNSCCQFKEFPALAHLDVSLDYTGFAVKDLL